MASTILMAQPFKLPLMSPAFRNDNTAGSIAKTGSGVTVLLRAGPGDYRAWNEIITDQTGAVTNYVAYYTAPSAIGPWTEAWRTLGPGGTVQASMTPASAAPENGEVCANTIPFWSPVLKRWVTYTHDGNNVGPRESRLWTSPDLTSNSGAGTWTKGAVVLVVDQTYEGTGNAQGDQLASDLKVRVSGTSLIGYYRAGDINVTGSGMAKVTGSASDPATLTKQGVKLSKSTLSNSGSVGTGYAGHVSLEGHYVDDQGRLHVWFIGDNAGGTVEAVCYAISDDELTITPQYNGAGVINGAGGTGADNIVVGQCSVLDDDDILVLYYGSYNLTASYTPTRLTGDAAGLPLRGNSPAYVPAARNTAATRPGRHFTWVGTSAAASGSATRQSGTVGSTAIRVLNQTAFSLYVEYKMPTQGVSRTLYAETQNFNLQSYLNVDSAGKLNGFYRNGSPTVQIVSGSRVDDGTWRAGCLVRSATASWALYDHTGTVLGTDTSTNPGSSASVPNITIGNWNATDPSAVPYPDEPAFATIRRVVVIAGVAMSAADIQTLWNSGASGGSLPAASTSANTRDYRPGSGGTGDDTELLNSITVTNANSPASVNAQPSGQLANLSGVASKTYFRAKPKGGSRRIRA